MSRKTLIVVDMLNDFCKEGGALFFPQSRGIIDAIKFQISQFRLKGWLIIWLCDNHAKNDLEFKRFPDHAVALTYGAKIISELDALIHINSGKDILIPKTRYSGFYGTTLDHVLRSHNPESVEVVGVCTSICVMDTVGGLANRDYKVVVPADCVADFDDGMHVMAMKRMEALYGAKVVSGDVDA